MNKAFKGYVSGTLTKADIVEEIPFEDEEGDMDEGLDQNMSKNEGAEKAASNEKEVSQKVNESVQEKPVKDDSMEEGAFEKPAGEVVNVRS